MKSKNILLTLSGLSVIFLTLVFYIVRSYASGNFYGNTDFYKFYQSALFYFSGQNMYYPCILQYKTIHAVKWLTSDGNLNPPFLTFLLLPLKQFNYTNALDIWTNLSIVFNILGLLIVLQAFPNFCKPLWKSILIIAAFLIYMPNSANLAYGQLSSPLLLLTAILWRLSRQNGDWWAGIVLGITAGLKVFYGLFFIFYFVIQRFRLFFIASLTYLATLLIGLWLFGAEAYMSYYKILHSVSWYASSWNPSFLGFFSRIFSSGENNMPLLNFPHLVTPLTMICSVILLIFLIRVWWNLKPTSLSSQNEDRFDIGFSLTLISMLLLSPLSWLYYFPILIIPYLILINQFSYEKRGYLFHLIACIVVFISTIPGNLMVAHEVKTLRQIILNSGFSIYSLLILLGLFIYLYRREVTRPYVRESVQSIISENYWIAIYTVILIPSMTSIIQISKNILTGHF